MELTSSMIIAIIGLVLLTSLNIYLFLRKRRR